MLRVFFITAFASQTALSLDHRTAVKHTAASDFPQRLSGPVHSRFAILQVTLCVQYSLVFWHS